jgi:hypothetical protein
MRLYPYYEAYRAVRALSDLSWLAGYSLGKRKLARQAAKLDKKHAKFVKRAGR